MSWPRLFLPSELAPAPEAPLEPIYVLDRFILDAIGGSATEMMTGLDARGTLALYPLDARTERLPSIQRHLAYAEVTHPERRAIRAAPQGLWLLSLELIEQLPDTPGLNDPIYLYGTLRSSDPHHLARAGQLTSTRGDLLRGLCEGAAWAFHYPPGAHERAPRCCHLMLPGDRTDALEIGQGLILAYPALDPALLGEHAGNEPHVAALAHDVLKALAADPEHVPQDRGFWRNLFTADDALPAPDAAQLDAFVRTAVDELARLPSWPNPASDLLFSHVVPWKGAAPHGPRRPPNPPALTPRPPPEVSASPPHERARREDWMRDFIAPHAARQPQLTSVHASQPSRRPTWMDDFK